MITVVNQQVEGDIYYTRLTAQHPHLGRVAMYALYAIGPCERIVAYSDGTGMPAGTATAIAWYPPNGPETTYTGIEEFTRAVLRSIAQTPDTERGRLTVRELRWWWDRTTPLV